MIVFFFFNDTYALKRKIQLLMLSMALELVDFFCFYMILMYVLGLLCNRTNRF